MASITQHELLSAELAAEIECAVIAAGCTGVLRYAMQPVFGLGATERIIGGQDPDGNHFSINSVEDWAAFKARGMRAEVREPEPQRQPEPVKAPAPEPEPQLTAEQIAALQPSLASLRDMARRRELAWQRWTALKGRRGVTAAKDEYKRLDFSIDSALWPIQMQLGGRAALTLAYAAIDEGRKVAKDAPAPVVPIRKVAEVADLDGAPAGLYVSGNTYPHRRELRGAGGAWDKPRQCWYFCCSELPASLRGIRGLTVRQAGTSAQISGEQVCRADAAYERAQGVA